MTMLWLTILGSASALAAPTAETAKPQKEYEIVLYGKVYRPAVFDLLARYRMGLDWDLDDPRFKRSFLDKVLRSVSEDPL